MNEKRAIIVKFRVNEEEYKKILSNTKSAGYTHIADYVRSLSLNRVIVQYNPELQKKTMSLMSNIANNMNQIALRVNEHRNIYQEIDIEPLAEGVENLCRTLACIASELRRLRQ